MTAKAAQVPQWPRQSGAGSFGRRRRHPALCWARLTADPRPRSTRARPLRKDCPIHSEPHRCLMGSRISRSSGIVVVEMNDPGLRSGRSHHLRALLRTESRKRDQTDGLHTASANSESVLQRPRFREKKFPNAALPVHVDGPGNVDSSRKSCLRESANRTKS